MLVDLPDMLVDLPSLLRPSGSDQPCSLDPSPDPR
jgi:hypothetical protein